MNSTGYENLSAALAVAEQWLDTIDEVIAVGEGDAAGVRTVDVWVAYAGGAVADLPDQVHDVPVRILDAGGPVETE